MPDSSIETSSDGPKLRHGVKMEDIVPRSSEMKNSNNTFRDLLIDRVLYVNYL